MKILLSADWHINLRKKKIPHAWQVNRFKTLFSYISELELSHDIHIIAGDIFDNKPDNEEVCLFLEFLNTVSIPTYIIPGNPEATRKGKSFLENFTTYNAVKNNLVHIFTENTRVIFKDQGFQYFPYGEMQVDNLPNYIENDILVTHIRGEVPPHISAEYNFERIRPWKLILLGDLHFPHKYKDFPAYYPGSPLNVIFDREESKQYGLYSIDFNSIDNYNVKFIDLDLPKLLRKRIKVGFDMIKHEKHHIVYEVTGSIDELSQIQTHELLDKKIAYRPSEGSKLNLDDNQSLLEELKIYLEYIKIENIDEVIKEFNSFNIS